MRLLLSSLSVVMLSACGGGAGGQENAQAVSSFSESSQSSYSATANTAPLGWMNAADFQAFAQQANSIDGDEQSRIDVVGETLLQPQSSGLYWLEPLNYAEQEIIGDQSWQVYHHELHFSSADGQSHVQALQAPVQAIYSYNDEALVINSVETYSCPVGAFCKPMPFFANPNTVFQWYATGDTEAPQSLTRFSLSGDYLASQQINESLVVATRFEQTPIAGLVALSEEGEIQAYLDQGCFYDELSSMHIGTLINISVIDLKTRTLSSSTCVRAEVASLNFEEGFLTLETQLGEEHLFGLSETKVDYLGGLN